jgi:hypothetical protein
VRIETEWLAACYFEEAWRTAVKLLSKDEAQRIALNIAKLPELVHFPR